MREPFAPPQESGALRYHCKSVENNATHSIRDRGLESWPEYDRFVPSSLLCATSALAANWPGNARLARESVSEELLSRQIESCNGTGRRCRLANTVRLARRQRAPKSGRKTSPEISRGNVALVAWIGATHWTSFQARPRPDKCRRGI